MRAYYFVNFYLSSIQQGIQALHTTAEMFTKYVKYSGDMMAPTKQASMLVDWATVHKTVIVRNGGDEEQLQDVLAMISYDAPYPWAHFVEEGIGDQLTCVGVILPAHIYEAADLLRKTPFSKREKVLNDMEFSAYDVKMVELIMNTTLAR